MSSEILALWASRSAAHAAFFGMALLQASVTPHRYQPDRLALSHEIGRFTVADNPKTLHEPTAKLAVAVPLRRSESQNVFVSSSRAKNPCLRFSFPANTSATTGRPHHSLTERRFQLASIPSPCGWALNPSLRSCFRQYTACLFVLWTKIKPSP